MINVERLEAHFDGKKRRKKKNRRNTERKKERMGLYHEKLDALIKRKADEVQAEHPSHLPTARRLLRDEGMQRD